MVISLQIRTHTSFLFLICDCMHLCDKIFKVNLLGSIMFNFNVMMPFGQTWLLPNNSCFAPKFTLLLFKHRYYYRCNNYMVNWKRLIKKLGLMSQFSGPLIGALGVIYAKSRTLCHAFQPLRVHYLCFVVFCLLFLITVGIQHQVFYSIITRN